MQEKILLISDEPNILRTLRRNLVGRGYEVLLALDDLEVFHMVKKFEFDAYVLNLDFVTANIDGLAICDRLRDITLAPIIVLSSTGSENIKIKVLDLGADDYLVMPFGMEEFLARIRASLRRWADQKKGANPVNKVFIFGNLLVDTDAHQVFVNGEAIHMTPTEYNLLHYLMKNAGKVITHNELLKEIWGPEYGGEREYLRTFISQVRHKIEDDPMRPKFILTESGVGYRFRISN